MNTVDVIVLIVVLGFGIQGAFQGLAWQLFRIGAWVLAIWLAMRYSATVGGWIPDSLVTLDETAETVIGWALILLAVRLAVIPLTMMVRKLLDRARLTSADRSLGFLIGSSKGILLVAFVLMIPLMLRGVLPDALTTQLYGKEDATPPILPSKAASLHAEFVAPRLFASMPENVQQEFMQRLAQRAPR